MKCRTAYGVRRSKGCVKDPLRNPRAPRPQWKNPCRHQGLAAIDEALPGLHREAHGAVRYRQTEPRPGGTWRCHPKLCFFLPTRERRVLFEDKGGDATCLRGCLSRTAMATHTLGTTRISVVNVLPLHRGTDSATFRVARERVPAAVV